MVFSSALANVERSEMRLHEAISLVHFFVNFSGAKGRMFSWNGYDGVSQFPDACKV